jgi:hypothetical protein
VPGTHGGHRRHGNDGRLPGFGRALLLLHSSDATCQENGPKTEWELGVARRPLDPRKCNVTIDNNALDRDGTARDLLIERLLELQRSRKVNIVVPQGVRREAQHPNTPAYVREEISSKIFTRPTELTAQELQERRRVELVLQGNGKAGKSICDARHLFEAGEVRWRLLRNKRQRNLGQEDQSRRRAAAIA